MLVNFLQWDYGMGFKKGIIKLKHFIMIFILTFIFAVDDFFKSLWKPLFVPVNKNDECWSGLQF